MATKTNSISKTKAYRIIEAIILIVLGILLAVSIVNSNILNIVLAIAILIIGVFYFVKGVTSSTNISFLLPDGIIGGILVACAIAMFASYLSVQQTLEQVIVIGVLAIGIILIVDAIVRFVRKNTTAGITEIIVGLVLVVLGLLFIFLPEVLDYLWVIFGILLAVYGIYLLVDTLRRLK